MDTNSILIMVGVGLFIIVMFILGAKEQDKQDKGETNTLFHSDVLEFAYAYPKRPYLGNRTYKYGMKVLPAVNNGFIAFSFSDDLHKQPYNLIAFKIFDQERIGNVIDYFNSGDSDFVRNGYSYWSKEFRCYCLIRESKGKSIMVYCSPDDGKSLELENKITEFIEKRNK